MTVAAFVFSAVSLALAVASLTWQFVTFALNGSRVVCELSVGAINGASGYAHQPATSWTGLSDQMRRQGFTDVRIFITARNVGRLAVSVTGYSIRTNTGQEFGTTRPEAWEKPLPRRLEPGDEETWSYEGANVVALVGSIRDLPALQTSASRRPPRRITVQGKIKCGSAKTALSKEKLSYPLRGPELTPDLR